MPRIRKLFNSTSALSIFLQMEEVLAVALGRKLAAHRESGLTSNAAFARIEELERRLRLLERWVEVYAALVQRIAFVHRFQWSPEARFEILKLKKAERLTATEAGRRASVSPSTIHRWEAEAFAHPERTTVGSLLKSIPPVRRIRRRRSREGARDRHDEHSRRPVDSATPLPRGTPDIRHHDPADSKGDHSNDGPCQPNA